MVHTRARLRCPLLKGAFPACAIYRTASSLRRRSSLRSFRRILGAAHLFIPQPWLPHQRKSLPGPAGPAVWIPELLPPLPPSPALCPRQPPPLPSGFPRALLVSVAHISSNLLSSLSPHDASSTGVAGFVFLSHSLPCRERRSVPATEEKLSE